MTAELPKRFDHRAREADIYNRWLNEGFFRAAVDERPPERRYTIMMPPPNVTGALHMGHSFYTLQDILIRWHRMRQDNTLWLPGTDHAGIATQATVEKRICETEGLSRHDIGREELVRRIWEWKETHGDRILVQLRSLGASADWERTRFTFDAQCSKAVRRAFCMMFAQGLIARKKRLVNWDSFLQTAVSDDEVVYETVPGKFYELCYPLVGGGKHGIPEHVTVATTRPETMLGDTAVAVHPDPEQALAKLQGKLEEQLASASEKDRPALEQELSSVIKQKEESLPAQILLRDLARAGQKVVLPLIGREIPLILDRWAKPEKGTGCVKITPAHDPNDYEVGLRNELPMINILDPDGRVNSNGRGSFRERDYDYSGLDFSAARERVVGDLQDLGLLGQVIDRPIEMPFSDRSKTPIEPYLSDQWFVLMGDREGGVEMGADTPRAFVAPGLAQAAIDAVEDGRVRFCPPRYAQTYLAWLAEKRDWCISRQLWWGHRIPIWTSTLASQKLAEADCRDLHSKNTGDRKELARLLGLVDLPAGIGFSYEKESHLFRFCSESEAQNCPFTGGPVEQDPDVLDTWFSSALWPVSTLGWPERTADLDYYYPTSTLVTAREIITLWVVRMVIDGLYTLGEVPFRDVFIHAVLQDGNGKKMSKTLGNGIDPVDIIDAYGTDAMRYVLCDMTTGTQDIRLPVSAICPSCGHHEDLTGKTAWVREKKIACTECEKEIRQGQATTTADKFLLGKNFVTKLWNAVRFGLMNLPGPNGEPAPYEKLDLSNLLLEDRWILHELSSAVRDTSSALAQYALSRVTDTVRSFFWDRLCDWYLELVKPRIRSGQRGDEARQVVAFCLDQVLRLLHPVMPFVTEELWGHLGNLAPERGLPGLAELELTDSLIAAPFPPEDGYPALESPEDAPLFSSLQQIVRAIRDLRAQHRVSPKRELSISISPGSDGEDLFARLPEGTSVLKTAARLADVTLAREARAQAGTARLTVAGLNVLVHSVVDVSSERKRLTKKLAVTQRTLAGCLKKLANPGFVSKANPSVVEREKSRAKTLEGTVDTLSSALTELSP